LILLAFVVLGLAASGARAEAASREAGVLHATLSNGLRVVIVRSTLAPVASVVVSYLAGSDEAPPGFPGMAHAQEHMMFRGSPGLSGDQLAYVDAALGGQANAATQQTVTQYINTVPENDVDLVLHIEALRMKGVDDAQGAWAKERGAIEQEVARDLSSPEYVLYTKLLKSLFQGTPYAHDALGTKPSFDKTTGTMLKSFYSRWYAPNNAILVVVGDVRPDAVLTRIKILFGDIPRKVLPSKPAVQLGPVQTKTLQSATDRANGRVIVAFRVPGYNSPDYAAVSVLADVLDSRRGPLYALAADGKALGTDVETDFLPQAGLIYAAAELPKGGDSAALLQQVKDVLAGCARNGFPDNLLAAAKRRAIMALELQKGSIPELAAAWSQALAVEGRRSPAEDVEAMQRVSARDLSRAAREYLSLDRAVLAVLTPQASGKPVTSQGFGGTESFTPQHPEHVEPPDWARGELESVSVPASALHPSDETLPNGLRLIIQPTSTGAAVSLHGRVRYDADLEAPPGKEGVDQVLGRLFSYGTASRGRLAFQEALDEIGAAESAGTHFSAVALQDHFDRAVELLAENELHPVFRQQDLAIVRRQIAAQIAGELESPGYLTRRALLAGLYPKGDPRLREATPETVKGLSIDDVKFYYHHVFRPDMTTLVVIGEVDPAKAKALVVKYFGGWKAVGPKPSVDLPRVPRNQASTTGVPDRSRVQDRVILGETLGLDRFSPDYYPLVLGNHVLGGGFYATRLYRDLRKRTGLVYTVGTSIVAGRTRALYLVEYGCEPQNVARARGIVEQDLREMQAQPVSAAELTQAKALLMRKTALGEASVSAIADGLLDRAMLGLPLNEPTLAAKRYRALSAEQVQATFARRLRLKNLVEVSQGPAPH
jgi:zinc protease